VEQRVTPNNIKILSVTQKKKKILQRIYVARKNKTYLDLQVICRDIFCPILAKNWILSIDILKSPQYQISQKKVQWEMR
jgi:hypothetical protein